MSHTAAQDWRYWPFDYTTTPMYRCEHCGSYHPGSACPRIKAIEYYPDGSIKRVEYKE